MEDIISEAQNIVKRLRSQKDNPDNETTTVPLFAVSEVLRLVATQTNDTVLHLFPILDERASPRAFALQIWRQLARRGINVRRTYAIPHDGFAREVLDAAIAEDEKHGVVSNILTLSNVPLDRSVAAINQSLICDDSVIFRSATNRPNPGDQFENEWILSTRQHEVKSGQDLWATIDEFCIGQQLDPNRISLDEPLILSADLIHGVANVLCSGDHVDRSDCSWYHGTWQYMRLLDLVSTPTWHDAFYRDRFEKALLAKKKARILITGTADYSVLAYVLAAAKRVGAAPEVTVLDQCATPLFACRWFANYVDTKIRTIQADIFDAPRIVQDRFDIITSDAFLTRFEPSDVKSIVSTWSQLLSQPGGQVITTLRLHGETVSVRDEEHAVADFSSRARARLPKWQQFVRRPSQALLADIEFYAKKMVSYRIGGEQDIRDIFEQSDIEIVHNEIGDVPGELYPTVYLRIVGERF